MAICTGQLNCNCSDQLPSWTSTRFTARTTTKCTSTSTPGASGAIKDSSRRNLIRVTPFSSRTVYKFIQSGQRLETDVTASWYIAAVCSPEQQCVHMAMSVSTARRGGEASLCPEPFSSRSSHQRSYILPWSKTRRQKTLELSAARMKSTGNASWTWKSSVASTNSSARAKRPAS